MIVADPEALGLCPSRLARIRDFVCQEIEQGRIPGAVVLVARRGRIGYFESLGYRDAESRAPMTPDAIFRIYSMTKAIVGVGAMILHEEGRLKMANLASRFLPQLGGLKVAVVEDGGRLRLVPAHRDVTVYDLLRHTSGIIGGHFGSPAVSELYEAAGIHHFDHGPSAYETSTQDLVEKLGELPLAHQPGTVFEYGRSADVLGRLVEVVADRPLDDFLRERIFAPLGMADTGFHLAPGTVHRAAQPLRTSDVAQPAVIDLVERPRFISAGSGALSTASDYLRFAQMLLGGGAVDGVRILGRKTVEYLASDHLGPLRETGPDYIPGPGYGFGFGLAVRQQVAPAELPGSIGELWWLGRAATSFLVDPAEELCAIAMTQKYWRARHYQAMFRSLVLQSLV